MLEHAKAMGFAVRQRGHARAIRAWPESNLGRCLASCRKADSQDVAAKKAPVKKPAVKQNGGRRSVAAKKAAVKKTSAAARG